MEKTCRLVQDSSFLSGIARSIDLFGTFTEYNQESSSDEADERALRSDFEAVGDDLWSAFTAIGDKSGK